MKRPRLHLVLAAPLLLTAVTALVFAVVRSSRRTHEGQPAVVRPNDCDRPLARDIGQGTEPFRERLLQAPRGEVVGLVGPNGPSGGQAPPAKEWSLRLELAAWRFQRGELQERPLVVQRMISEAELRRYQEEIEPYTILRFRARVLADGPCGTADALPESFPQVVEAKDEPALGRIAAKLQEPVTFEDPVLGTFTLDRRIDWYTATVSWGGRRVELHLDGVTPDELRGALATAHALWKDQDGWSRRISECAVRNLLELKNESWVEEDAEVRVVSPEEFEHRMQLEEIVVHDDGSFDFAHDDGDLFFGHTISVTGDLERGPTDAQISG